MKARTNLAITLPLIALAMVLAQFGAQGLYAQQTDRAKRLGGKLMCMCGCNQILTACNHVGCTTSSEMLKKLDIVVARNEPDNLTLQAFVQEYGERVLAEPPHTGFNRVAWFIPGVAFALGLVIVVMVISHWRRRMAAAPEGPAASPELLERVRKQADEETEE